MYPGEVGVVFWVLAQFRHAHSRGVRVCLQKSRPVENALFERCFSASFRNCPLETFVQWCLVHVGPKHRRGSGHTWGGGCCMNPVPAYRQKVPRRNRNEHLCFFFCHVLKLSFFFFQRASTPTPYRRRERGALANANPF